MISIAHSELLQIFRNRSVLVTGLIVPIAANAFFIARREDFEEVGSLGYIAAVIVFTVAAFSLYSTSVTTLAARRQTLFLKRLRSTAASDGAILSGLILPVTVLAVIQVASMLAVFAAVADRPTEVAALGVAIVAALVMMLAFAVATAGFTRSPEHAQVTTLPLALGAPLLASWVGISGTEDLTILKRLLPGGAATELIVEAWNEGVSLADALPLLVPTFAWVVVAMVLAARLFRWEPR
jgi:ABC-2 type transport system permease protein